MTGFHCHRRFVYGDTVLEIIDYDKQCLDCFKVDLVVAGPQQGDSESGTSSLDGASASA